MVSISHYFIAACTIFLSSCSSACINIAEHFNIVIIAYTLFSCAKANEIMETSVIQEVN